MAMMTFTRQNVHQPLKKSPMRGGKSDAGGPEKQLILFVWPNCTNPRSVVVMDNASIHHVDKVVALIEEVGAIVIYLPPYSPDIMPIEECFSKVKAYLRANDPLIQVLEGSEIEDAILSAFASVAPSDCYGWVKDCGYIHRD